MSKINLLKKTGDKASLSLTIWEDKRNSNPESAGLNQEKKTLKTPKINQKTSNVGKRMRVFISEQAASVKTASQKTSIHDFVQESFLKLSKILPSKIAGLGIHQKIGGGYFLAIGIGFIGSVSGLAIADYYQGQGLKQLNDAHIQAQLLGNFKDAALAAQLQGAQLDSFVDNSAKLELQEEQFVQSIVKAKNLRLRIEKFADSQPAWLAAKPEVLKTLVQDCTQTLESYADTLSSTLQQIGPQLSPPEIESTRKMLATESGLGAEKLDSSLQKLSQILDIAQQQERQGGAVMEEAQGIEKAIIMMSMLLSVAVAGMVAYRTSRAIAKPVISVTQVAEQVAAESNFDLRVPVTGQDEIGSLAVSLNHLIERVSEHTKEMEQARQVAVTANSAKSQFLANMSHELRTPLHAIIGYSQLLLEDARDSGCKDFVTDLDKIENAGTHLLSLVNDILDFSKIEAGGIKLEIEEFDIQSLIENVASATKPLVGKNGNVLDIECDRTVGTMHADFGKLRQVLMHLLNNAAKFTKNGRVKVSVRRVDGTGESNAAKLSDVDNSMAAGCTEKSSSIACPVANVQESDWIYLSVKDTGIGMSEEQQHKLFEAFVQAECSATRQYGGTGLGLTISRHYCEMMGGKIFVESEEGKGSIFTVQIPAGNE